MVSVCAEEYVDLLAAAANRTWRTLTDDLRLLTVGTAPVQQTVAALYDDLTAELLGSRQVDVRKSVTRFFDELFALVVRRHVLGISAIEPRRDAATEAQHVRCIRSLRRTLSADPFDGVDDRFAEDAARAINASRALLDALRVTSRTVTAAATENWPPTSPGCRRALTRLRMCALCDGRADWNALRPCRGLCVNVARGCLAGVAVQLGPRWESFVDGLAELVARSHGPHNDLELVSSTLDGTVARGVLQLIRNAPKFYSKVSLLLHSL